MLKRFLTRSLAIALLGATAAAGAQTKLGTASYDISRELFGAINPLFVAHWKETKGEDLNIEPSFGGTTAQANAILQGLPISAVSFNQVTDINLLANRGFVAKDWQQKFANNSSPYYSTIAFLVRKDNPKNIKNWDDLVREDVKLVFPNPKTSGNARYTYLGAWLYANEKFGGDQAKTREFVSQLLGNVETFPTGGRGATTAFANEQGDVLLTFESEVNNIAKSDEFKDKEFEIVVPPVSVLAEFPVAVVDRVAKREKTEDVAREFLQFQYSPEIQALLANYNYRVHDPEVVKANADRFPEVRLLNPQEVLGDWDSIQSTHFASGGVLDELLAQAASQR
ncbi:thiosulfate ABC transporter substrate-binding protein CysP [Kerstersia sp.]|uniref:thiosulfate ABC transporter substrate-binding protein CysP n=1 Tax=Kerstersia sp. TaxID=1930783 RepID=UPI003F8F4FF0